MARKNGVAGRWPRRWNRVSNPSAGLSLGPSNSVESQESPRLLLSLWLTHLTRGSIHLLLPRAIASIRVGIRVKPDRSYDPFGNIDRSLSFPLNKKKKNTTCGNVYTRLKQIAKLYRGILLSTKLFSINSLLYYCQSNEISKIPKTPADLSFSFFSFQK